MVNQTFSATSDARGSQEILHEGDRQFAITVNSREVVLRDPLPVGRQVLVAAGLNPADEHVLIELLQPGAKSIGLDEEIDLRTPGREKFRAFKSDRIYLFTVDGLGHEWGAAIITEAELRLVAVVPEDRVLVIERTNDEDLFLTAGTQIEPAQFRTERLRTATKVVRVFLDDTKEKLIPGGKQTTEELLVLLEVSPGYLLNVLDHAGQLQPLQPGQVINVKKDMKFYSQAPGGGAS
jgi:hypothetical protein